jgi:hypothetical protein
LRVNTALCIGCDKLGPLAALKVNEGDAVAAMDRHQPCTAACNLEPLKTRAQTEGFGR